MKILSKMKDGGPESPVDGYFLIEWKSLFSIVILKFNKGRRENYHSHAFNAYTWFLFGDLVEETQDGKILRYKRSIIPKYTPRENCHRVYAHKNSWCLSVRGPWVDIWYEYDPIEDKKIVLTHGRKVIEGPDV